MKKIILVLLLCVMAIALCGCSSESATTESNHKGFFVKIKDYQDGATNLVYDPFTKIVYITMQGTYYSGFSPYYTIKFGEPVIAIYGQNWTEADLK